MKVRVEREVLGEAVAWVARALPSRPVVPVLAGMLIEAGDGLTLSCFDYEVSARVWVDADVEETGTALVPGRLLAEITRSLPAAPVEFSSDVGIVGLNCESAEFALTCLPLEDYPPLPDVPAAAGTVDGAALGVAAAQVVPAASRDDTLPMLTAVCLDIDGETLTLAATDRYRLAVSELRWDPAGPGLRASAMVPARTLADVARTMAPRGPVTVAFGVSDGSGTVTAAGAGPRPSEGMISFECDARRLTARLIAGEFIKYRSRFPTEFGCRAEVPAGRFTEAVRRVSLVADRASPVTLEFAPGSVVIEAQEPGRARAVETVSADFQGDERTISFSPHYLLDGLSAAVAGVGPARLAGTGPKGDGEHAPLAEAERPGSAGRILIEFTSAAKPALITWAGGEHGAGGPVAGETAAAPHAAGETATAPHAAGETATAPHAAGEAGSAGDHTAGDDSVGGQDPAAPRGGADGPCTPPFRYLVVPLRPPARP
jgi:DNA polymerase III subunit beta